MSVAVQDIVDESSLHVSSPSHGGLSGLLWFISRAMLNRLAHYVTGNPSQVSAELKSYNDGEAVYKVQGKLGVRKVSIGARGRKAFINEGACRQVGCRTPDPSAVPWTQQPRARFTSVLEDTTSVPGAEAIRRGLSALGDPV